MGDDVRYGRPSMPPITIPTTRILRVKVGVIDVPESPRRENGWLVDCNCISRRSTNLEHACLLRQMGHDLAMHRFVVNPIPLCILQVGSRMSSTYEYLQSHQLELMLLHWEGY